MRGRHTGGTVAGGGGGGNGADAIRLEAVRKVYGTGRAAVAALDGVTAVFPPGGFTAVMGPSGSGKSTFLHCAAGLDRPTEGRVLLGGVDLGQLSETALTTLRRDRVGFVFQAFNLMSALDVRDNITLPLRLAGRRPDGEWLTRIVSRVGLADRLGHRPAELSGGQQQRVAIARALVTRPAVVFADEPTGALDATTAHEVLGLLRGVVDGLGQTVVMVTHDPVAASYADRVLFLAGGRLVDELRAPTAEAISHRMRGLRGGAEPVGVARC
ncbi:putative ABC transport system ATP-binding protein [Streptoalloteichus tenebrarius]|uniref:ABC transport system ATP-binding protein n=1 Tax=Streptoalloteichus tenebrarius (strain ATCC 17920 / DSM 40477 / JCM 4838 / CBS 697.72 / NBRC 16177 / NCIMB 11028 / NRRL B-12390 / A12253. 1 / ISP 5477) TaxID=1933 RepID=A0ABT1HTW7_STRSD|nr:ABC transporter ATP-binding protein [Streptoalloteichus tenebrarius]MCP2258971.1 putative ABC transport system ATP-binding protein [Streptoalloteichus tenebrarius]